MKKKEKERERERKRKRKKEERGREERGKRKRVLRLSKGVCYSLYAPLATPKGSKYALNTVIGPLFILIIIFPRFRLIVVTFITLRSRFI